MGLKVISPVCNYLKFPILGFQISHPKKALKPESKNILQVREVSKRYGARLVVKGVDLNLSGGEVVGLLGPNGAGKTTTFSIVTGFTRPSNGRVELNGRDITSLPAYRRAREGLVYLPQESSVFRKLTVEENIRAIAQSLKLEKKED